MANWSSGSENSINEKLSKAIGAFGAQLGSSKMGTLTQAWVPEPGDDGGVVMNTQGLSFSVNGTADLLALFRCISCKYKFSTDTTKPRMMGPVGRVYISGEPELTRSVQQYDQSVYLRVAEAQRCHVNCCLFLPVYATSSRDRVAAVMEVVQTEDNERFAGLIDWAKVCLEGAGLWTIEAEGDTIGLGLRTITTEFEASAFESKVDARAGGVVPSLTGAASMPPPLPALAGGRSIGLGAASNGVHTQPAGWQHPGLVSFAAGTAAEADDAIGGSEHAEHTLRVSNRGGDTPGAAAVPLRPSRIIQIGNQLIMSDDAPLQQHVWQNIPKNTSNNNNVSNGNLGSGSGGSSEPTSQHPIPGVHANALAAAKAAAINLNGYGALPLDAMVQPRAAAAAAAVNGDANGWASIGGVVNVPQGYATSYGHGDNAITLSDLSPHFNLSLRDAAAKMDISVTTLKRACRRLGLQRWPRRELASKANEASHKAAAVAAAAAAADHLFSWTSGQTISADSTGDRHHVAAAAAMATEQGHGGGGMPLFNTRTAAAAAAQHMIRPPFSNTGAAAQIVFVPGIDPPAGGVLNGEISGGGGRPNDVFKGDGVMGDLNTQNHSLESLDILAADDLETFSVGNSPPGDRNRGGDGAGGAGDGDGPFSTAHMPGPLSTAI